VLLLAMACPELEVMWLLLAMAYWVLEAMASPEQEVMACLEREAMACPGLVAQA
jgi:hypothetical protein